MKKKSTSPPASFNVRVVIALVLCAAACFIVTGTLPAFSRPDAPARTSRRTLSFGERVVYQRAVEEVYWRHRIWPKERPDPKPSLDAVMSQAQLEKKVADYLRNSQALEDHWQRPITAEQLQGEMDRMAKHTKQPEVLRELFEALGNDAFVIAECLARPALAERLLTTWYAYDQRIHNELKRRAEVELHAHLPSIAAEADNTVEHMKQLSGRYSEIEYVKSDSSHQERQLGLGHDVKLNSREWDENLRKLAATFVKASIVKAADFGVRRDLALQSADMSAHSNSAAAENDEIIPVGKLSPLQDNETCYSATAVIEKTEGRLKLARVAWLKEPLESWLAKRQSQTSRMMIAVTTGYTLPAIGTGACSDDTWTNMHAELAGRIGHTAVWTGSEMIIWGGSDAGTADDTGARYNPSTDTWAATSTTNAPAGRDFHTAVWTGKEMIVWGGRDTLTSTNLNTGGKYNSSTDSWTATSTDNAPQARHSQAAVWTGSEMIIWGGCFGNECTPLNTGGRYNPSTNTWTATTTINAPSARAGHTAVWTGAEMIIWGGCGGGNPCSSFNTGGRYNPSTDSWTATSLVDAPTARDSHSAVWTGAEMVVWGGWESNGPYYNTGGRYNPNTDSWTSTSLTNAPSARNQHTAVWTGNEMIVWGGFFYDGRNHYLNTGGSYNPGTDSWTGTTTTNAPEGRITPTAVWIGSEMIVWGGRTYPEGNLNTGGRYNPSADTWTVTARSPSQRNLHTAVWTGSEMIVWGGEDQFSDIKKSGGRYNPSTDSWTATSTANAPAYRYSHTAVWTGSDMIVWGGIDELVNLLNTGGRYNPSTDSWTNISTSNAPEGRYNHRAVWSGSEMIVWGGFHDTAGHAVNTGGRYNPDTDSWTATSTTNAPSGRGQYQAVWTGNEMIVWGGCSYDPGYQCLNTGGRYDSITDSWTPTSTTNAPSARGLYAAVWSGSEMIIWGGNDQNFLLLDTGGRYNPETDNWTVTSTTNAPVARFRPTAVWTGSEMIVWGGQDQNFLPLDTGGRYDPAMDSWMTTTTTNAPAGRYSHTAVWTGNEMIVWGGATDTEFFNTGERYCAQTGPTPTPSSTPTPTVTPTPRPTPTPRARPTPPPRPTPSR
jgi:N-acetylneuraminic acid mutarotase